MKTLGWLAIAAVMIVGGLVEYGGPVRSAAEGGLVKDGTQAFDAGAGLPTFTYAKPIPFDVRRTPVPVRVKLWGRTLTFVLEGAALDRARRLVTIDPLFGVAEVDSTDAGGH